MKFLAPFTLSVLLLAGCVAGEETSTTPPEGEFGFSKTAQAKCLEQDGTYQRRGMLGRYSCAVPFADAGKACTKPSDCEGQCRVETAEDEFGKCQADSDPFGCHSHINEEGQVVAICVD